MKIVGYTKVGAATAARAANQRETDRYTFPACRIAKLSVYLDGLGGAGGQALVRPVVYDGGGNLLAQGDEFAVNAGAAPAWVDLGFSPFPGGVSVAAGNIDIGLLNGGDSGVLRYYADAVAGYGLHSEYVDTYSDGAANPAGAGSGVSPDLMFSWYATYTTPWVSAERPEEEIARLPWAASQAIFGATGEVISSLLPGTLGWYGSSFDDDLGAFALAAEGGAFASLVGQRVAISNGARVAYVYVRDTAVLNDGEDLAVPLRVYAALELLTQVPIQVEVEAVA